MAFTNTATSTNTAIRGLINLNDSTRTMEINNNGASAISINSTGGVTIPVGLTTTAALACSVTAAANSTTVTVNPYVTFPSAGVYLLFISQCSGTSSSTPELIDNLAKLFIVICSSSSTQLMQMIQLYNPSNGWMEIVNISNLSFGLRINSGSFTYRAFYQKVF
jgi:hypothetical protein